MRQIILAICAGAFSLMVGQSALAEPASRSVFRIYVPLFGTDSVEIAQAPASGGKPEQWIAVRVDNPPIVPPVYYWTDGASCPQLGLLLGKLSAFRFSETPIRGPQIDGYGYVLMDRSRRKVFVGVENSSLNPLRHDVEALKPCWREGRPPPDARWPWVIDNWAATKVSLFPYGEFDEPK